MHEPGRLPAVPERFAHGHDAGVQGGLLDKLPRPEGLEQLLIDGGDYEKPLLFYCYRGVESKKKADYFANRGFKRVYSLENGYTGWPRENAMAARQF